MSTDKALDKFSYYDTLSNLLPGVVFLWALTALGPLPKGAAVGGMMTGNVIIDPILLIVLSYVVGHVLQFLSKYSIEPILKKIFWKGQFFSDMFLVSAYRLCTKEELQRYIDFAEIKLGFKKEDLSVLMDPEVVTDESKEKKAMQLSGAIYHSIDAKTQDTTAGQKAHIQNTFYSFFRNLSLSFLALAIMDLVAMPLKYLEPKWSTVLLILLNLALSAVFLIRAKERGERYIKGLFWSYI
jgi:hypothetical protein